MRRISWRQVCGVVLCAVLLVSPIVASPSQALAVAIPGFTGYVGDQFGIINYAVLSPFDSFAGILAGAYVPRPGDAAFDASKYTYLYQVASLPTLTGTGVQVRWNGLEPESRASLPISATTVTASSATPDTAQVPSILRLLSDKGPISATRAVLLKGKVFLSFFNNTKDCAAADRAASRLALVNISFLARLSSQ